MNWGMWIGIIGAAVGAIIAIAVTLATGEILPSVIVIASIGLFGALMWFFLKPIFQANKLKKTGIQKQGKLISYSDTGVTINNSPQVKFKIELLDDLNRPYEANAKTIISRLDVGKFYAGMPVVCWVDRNDKMKIAIDFFGTLDQVSSGSPNQPTAPAQDNLVDEWEKILQQMEDTNNEIRKNGIAAEAKIISATDLGPRVNGNNPFMQFYLEVSPSMKEVFYAEAKAVIGEQALLKYQPGKKIFVKYLADDLSRVAIDYAP